jgi:hypothetical protein
MTITHQKMAYILLFCKSLALAAVNGQLATAEMASFMQVAVLISALLR